MDRVSSPLLAVEQNVAGDLAAGELWGVVRGQLPGETERILADLSLVPDVKLAEEHARYPAPFARVADVY